MGIGKIKCKEHIMYSKKDLHYKHQNQFNQRILLSLVFILISFTLLGIISPNYAIADNLPDEFKNTEDYQILEFENSICAVKSDYNLVSNEPNEKNFTYSLDNGNQEGIYLSIKELKDDSLDLNPSDLKEPYYKSVNSEDINVANTPVKIVSFTDTNGGEKTNSNWVEYTIYTFDKNGMHYQIISYTSGGLLDTELEKIIESFTKNSH